MSGYVTVRCYKRKREAVHGPALGDVLVLCGQTCSRVCRTFVLLSASWSQGSLRCAEDRPCE